MEKKKLTRTKPPLSTVEEQERAVELLNQKAEAAANPAPPLSPKTIEKKQVVTLAPPKPAPKNPTVPSQTVAPKRQQPEPPPPDEKTLYSYNVKLDSEIEQRVKAHIARTGKNMKGFFQIAIREYLDAQGD